MKTPPLTAAITLVVLVTAIPALMAQNTVTNANYGLDFTLGDDPPHHESGSWPFVSPEFHDLVSRFFDRTIPWIRPDGSNGGSHTVLGFVLLHGGENIQAQSEMGIYGHHVLRPPGDLTFSKIHSTFTNISYHYRPSRRFVWSPFGIDVPLVCDVRLSSSAKGYAPRDGVMGWATAEVSIQSLVAGGTIDTKQYSVYASSGKNNNIPYTGNDGEAATYRCYTEAEATMRISLQTNCVGNSSVADDGGSGYLELQAIADPVLRIDPAATIVVSGTTYLMTDLYELQFSAGFSGGTAPLSPYGLWASDRGLDALTTGAPGLDHDHDGIANGIEFVTGSDPTAFTPGNPVTLSLNGSNLVITFVRSEASKSSIVSVITGTDLQNWPEEFVVPTGSVTGPPVTVVDSGSFSPDSITIVIPRGSDLRKFVRLKLVIP